MKPLSLIKCHGGKSKLSEWIVSHFPPHYELMAYKEPFAGGASVFFRKKESVTEVISDVDYGLICLYEIVKTDVRTFIEIVQGLEYNEETFRRALEYEIKFDLNHELSNAVNEYILRRMSRGALKQTFAWSDRLRGGHPGDRNAWDNAIKQLPDISCRLQNTYILLENFRDALDNLPSNCLVYADPPYVHSTRTAKKAYGQHEMSQQDHEELLDIILASPAKILISGYNSELYNTRLRQWCKSEKEIVNHSGQNTTKGKRTEVLWRNYEITNGTI